MIGRWRKSLESKLTPIAQRFVQRAWQIMGRASIRLKVLGIVIGMIIVLGVAVILEMRFLLHTTLENEMRIQGIHIVQDVARKIDLSLLDTSVDQPELSATLQANKEHYSSGAHDTRVAYFTLVDLQKQVIATTGPSLSATLDTGLPLTEPRIEMTKVKGQTEMDIAVSLPSRRANLHIGLAEDVIAQTVYTVTTDLLSITLVMVALGFLPAFFLTWVLTRPIYTLVNATHRVAQGDFTAQVPRWADDELGELAVAFNHMTQALEKADKERTEREQLRAHYVSGVIEAQEDERKRIARELHDSTSQALTSLLVGLQTIKDTPRPDVLNARIDELRGIIGVTLDEVRTMAWRLRPMMLDDLGLLSALERHVDDFQHRYGLTVDLLVTGIDQRLPIEMETAVYRIIQEALTNIARYAQAESVSVILDRHGSNLRVIVEDNGVGFDPAAVSGQGAGLGLQGIRERAALFGGRFEIESAAGQGTTLYIELPFVDSGELSRSDAPSP